MAFFRGDIFSSELQMNTSITVFIPEHVDNSKLDVLYLLHGLSDNCSNWLLLTNATYYAREYNLAIVTCEVQRSFYTDMAEGIRYFTYVSEELPQMMHEMFGLSRDRGQNFIAGLSMGGYGALKCGLTYPERYAGVGAFSSACDVGFNREKRYIDGQRLGELNAIFGPEGIPEKDDLYKLAEKAKASTLKPRIYMSCGESDSLLPQNQKMQSYLKERGFDVCYEEWEGEHNWKFWDRSVYRFMEHVLTKK